MSEQKMQGYGYVADTDESLVGKVSAKFGGNFGVAYLTKFAYNPNTAKEGNPPVEAIEATISVLGTDKKIWFNPITNLLGKDGQKLTDTTSQEYITAFNSAITQQNAVIVHYLKAVGVTEEAIKTAFSTPPSSFKEYAERVCSLLPKDFDKKPLDIFMEYQWNIGKKQDGSLYDRTYPTVPANMKGGYFLIPAQPGIWVEERNPDGSLCYKNSTGILHPFERNANFMSSNKGTQQIIGGKSSDIASAAMNAGATSANKGW